MGVGISFPKTGPSPVPTFLEFEAGFAGCSFGWASGIRPGPEFNVVFNEWFDDMLSLEVGGGCGAADAASALGDVPRADGKRLPGMNAAMLSRLHELSAHLGGGGGGADDLGLEYLVRKALGRPPTREEMTAVTLRIRDEMAALGDAAAAEEEATRLRHQQHRLHDPTAAAAAAAVLGQAEFNGPYCSDDDPYSTIPLTMQVALVMNLVNPSEIAFTLESRQFSLGRMFMILIPPLKKFEWLMDIAKIIAPFLDLTFSWDYLYCAFNPSPFPVVLYSGTMIPGGFTLKIENFSFMVRQSSRANS